MIDQALNFIVKKLNEYFQSSGETQEKPVVLSSLVNQQGEAAPNVSGKIVCSLIGIEKDSKANSRGTSPLPASGSAVYTSPPLFINVYLLFAAHFTPASIDDKKYEFGLAALSQVILFFQGNPVFTTQDSPEIGSFSDKLTLEIFEQSQSDQAHMWTVLGAKYMPSVVYKLRMLTFDMKKVSQIAPLTREVVSTVGLKE